MRMTKFAIAALVALLPVTAGAQNGPSATYGDLTTRSVSATGQISAGKLVGPLSGNAATASALATPRTITTSGDAACSFLFDGSANAGCALTLAPSGATAGSYGSGTAVPTVTVDAKGRVTGITSTPIAFPITSVAGRTGAVTLSVADVSGAASTAALNSEVSRAQTAETLLSPVARQIATGAGLTGGGDLSADRTLAIAANGVTNSLLATAPAGTIKGNAGSSAASPSDLTPAQAKGVLGYASSGANTDITSLALTSGTVAPATTTATDLASLSVSRVTTHSGGTPGFVNSAVRGLCVAGVNVANFEWCGLFRMDNYAAAGENVGAYLQGNKYGAGATWAAVSEIYEKSGAADPTSGTITHEFDLNAVGTDANNNRVIGDFVLRRPSGSSGAKVYAFAGLRFQGEANASHYNNLITTLPGLEVDDGLNLSNATVQGAAIRLATNQTIALDATGANSISYNSTVGTPLLNGGLTVQPAALATSSGASATALNNYVNVGGNGDSLKFIANRITTGSDWTSVGWRLGRSVDGSEVSTSMDFLQAGLRVNGAMGFNGAMPVGKQTLAAALPTDGTATPAQLATAYNSLRTALINLGLAQ